MTEPRMEDQIWESDWNGASSSSSSSLLLARSLDALLGARQRELDAALSRADLEARRKPGGSLDEALLFLHKYVKDCVHRSEPLDPLLVPIIESVMKSKGSKRSKQLLSVVQWLFEYDEHFFAFASDLVGIITKKVDHYISLGWCILVRRLVSLEFSTSRLIEIGKYSRLPKFLKILSKSIARLSIIVSEGSVQHDGHELPTRLSVAAADCILVLTEAFTEKKQIPDIATQQHLKSQSNVKHRLVTMLPSDKAGNIVSGSLDGSEPIEMKQLLWDHLDELISLVQKLQAWNGKSRPLHAKGLGQVLKWLKVFKGSSQDGLDELMIKTGQSLLASCWKHYAKLLRLEDDTVSQNFMGILDQYLDAVQIYLQESGHDEQIDERSSIETGKFFLICLSLILGHLDSAKLELAISESGPQILNILFAQIRCMDEDVTEGSLNILRAIVFRSFCPTSGSKPPNFGQMEAALPLLLNLLDERDVIARAVISFVAEYCFLNPDQCIQEFFRRLDSKNHIQRRNAIDVLSALMAICSDSGNDLPSSLSHEIAKHLLERLGDEELLNRVQAAKLFSQLEPTFVMPALLKCIYSCDKRVQSGASDAVVALMKCRKQKLDAVFVLLDCLGDVNKRSNASKVSGQVEESLTSSLPHLESASKVDIDLILRLTPQWIESVEDWSHMIEPLLDKMFGDPSNAVLLRFLSYISEKLSDHGNEVLQRILLHIQEQNDINESLLFKWKGGSFTEDNSIELKDLLFSRLCPLLIIRLLPLRVLDDLHSSVVYGELLGSVKCDGNADEDCIAALLVNRAFRLLEFEDVRKIAAELCGRLHPQVILPIIGAQMEHAVLYRDTLKIKAGLFATCSSLMIRGKFSLCHPAMAKIQKLVGSILLWPSLDSDEVTKAQHGCIDCLAFMILAELQTLQSVGNSTESKVTIIEEPREGRGPVSSAMPVIGYVIQTFTCQRHAIFLSNSNIQFQEKSFCTLTGEGLGTLEKLPLSFRLCMANVLISTCQKISGPGKLLFAQQAFPALIHFVEVMDDPDIKAASLQVLFTAVYHFKGAILPYCTDLFRISMMCLRKGSEKERIAGAKLLASLMASEDVIIDSISASFWEAKSLLESISMLDASSELRQLCEKLLSCITSPLDDNSFALGAKSRVTR